MVGVLALQGDVTQHLTALHRLGGRGIAVRRPEELAQLDGLIIPGGESTTMIKLAVLFGLFAPLRKLIAAGLPAYGSCAGMILLADKILDGTAWQQTIGGIDITVRRNAFGRQVQSFEAPVAMSAIGTEPIAAVFIRAPWVEQVGPAAEVLATVRTGSATGRIVAVRQGALMATSFHPELSGDDRVHEYFLHMVRAGGAR